MKFRLVAFPIVMLLCSCTSARLQPTGHTLDTDPRLGGAAIADICAPEVWTKLKYREYKAFVIINASIEQDDGVRLTKLRQCYPDASWETTARTLAKGLKVGAATIGTRLAAEGEVVVVFYEPDQSGDDTRVVVFARRTDEPGTGMVRAAKTLRLYHHVDE